ncbi:MAG: flagellar biosynthesis anti-sigma factor FlgM [Deltaproteobacteria bacterium]|nr:flagellar biosynthesis anti-sigma factor FlgM [Deltaproteobacteria bacterium]
MRIHDAYTKLDRTAGGPGVTKGREATGAGKSPASAGGASHATGAKAEGVEVAVSSRARELAAAADVSAARVSALRERIAAGSFSIDAHGIAAKLVGSDT